MKRLVIVCIVCIVAVFLLLWRPPASTSIRGLSFTRGPINGAIIEWGGARLAVYGHPDAALQNCQKVLVTHHRRDVLWAARKLSDSGAKVVAPAAEQELIAAPGDYWQAFTTKRFHDYAQQSTKVLGEPLSVDRWVRQDDVVEWQGLRFRVLDTPGYTRGAVSYLLELNGKRIAFTGDLIYGDGQLIDLYSFQDAIPEANIRGYHGYASRLAMLIPSLRKIADYNPHLIVPARGPLIGAPKQAIGRLIDRVQAVYHNYLSTNALNWYFKEERMRVCGERVLGPDADVQLMSYALHRKTPEWIWEQGTSRLLMSETGRGFLLDCGNESVLTALKQLMDQRQIDKIDGIFVTHCHDDHTDKVQAAAGEFDCPVYALEEYEDVLQRPGAYHTPALSPNAIENVQSLPSGHQMQWHEFQFTFYFYPGQMFYHGALLVEKNGEKPIFFIGDSFSQSGIDDYCLLNRNLLHEDIGYLACLKQLREFRGNYWLINEHIPFVFSFNENELDYLESRYRGRIAMLRQLFPWDDPNYGIDEQWAVLYPYGSTVEPGGKLELQVRITNHSPQQRTFAVTPHVYGDTQLLERVSNLTLDTRQSGQTPIRIQVPRQPGTYIVTADIDSPGMSFSAWVEALITVK